MPPKTDVVSPTAAQLTRLLRDASDGRLSSRITGLSSDDPLFEIAEAANDLLDRVETANREVLGAMGAAREGRRPAIGECAVS